MSSARRGLCDNRMFACRVHVDEILQIECLHVECTSRIFWQSNGANSVHVGKILTIEWLPLSPFCDKVINNAIKLKRCTRQTNINVKLTKKFNNTSTKAQNLAITLFTSFGISGSSCTLWTEYILSLIWLSLSFPLCIFIKFDSSYHYY